MHILVVSHIPAFRRNVLDIIAAAGFTADNTPSGVLVPFMIKELRMRFDMIIMSAELVGVSARNLVAELRNESIITPVYIIEDCSDYAYEEVDSIRGFCARSTTWLTGGGLISLLQQVNSTLNHAGY